MGIVFRIYEEEHKCTVCNKIYDCIDLKNNFCRDGFHSIHNVFLCNHCPNGNNFCNYN